MGSLIKICAVPDKVAIFGSLTIPDLLSDPQTAIKLAELVLPIYENEHPNDDRPRKAIAAAKAYLANPTDQNLHLLIKARKTTAKARNAAYYDTHYTTYEARNAAYAAYNAADAAYYAAFALKIKQVKIVENDTLESTLKSDSWVNLI